MITREDVNKIWHSTLEIAQMPAPLFKLIAQLMKERDEALAYKAAYREAFILHICDQMGYPGAERDIAEKYVDKAVLSLKRGKDKA